MYFRSQATATMTSSMISWKSIEDTLNTFVTYFTVRTLLPVAINYNIEGGKNDPVKQWAFGSRKRSVKEPHSSQWKNPRTLEGSPSKTSPTPCLLLSRTGIKLSQRRPLCRQVSLSTSQSKQQRCSPIGPTLGASPLVIGDGD